MTGTLRRYDQLTQILLSKREPNAGAWRGVAASFHARGCEQVRAKGPDGAAAAAAQRALRRPARLALPDV